MAANAPSTSVQEFISRDTWKNHSYGMSGPGSPHAHPTKASPMATARHQLELINSVSPFSTATSVLDIACGPGTVYRELFSSNLPLSPTAALLATDISAPMISHITARQAEHQPGDEHSWARVKAWVADATNLDTVPSDSQSHVVSQMGIFLIPDSDAALTEVRRVMRKDGKAVFSMSSVAKAAWNQDIMCMVEELHPERKMPTMPRKWCDKGLFKEELERNGFKGVRVEEFKMGLGYEDEEKTVEMLWKNMPFIPQVTRGMSEEEIKHVKAKMVERMKERFPGKEMPGLALIGVASV
ncbi:hypothetical protein B9Z65_4254 [Elsinoe australis]|uniref:Methyltransferase domain-containing protein n=1 Tax=Elsinoe australis TaxID=40998 RepID=A0A2P7Z293_9PEZI|nr:hypothetical protein B9Z65_4254 [Elsinoe australis]